MSAKTQLVEVLEIPKHPGEYGKGSIHEVPDGFVTSFYDHQGRRRRKQFRNRSKTEKYLNEQIVLRDKDKLDQPENFCKVDALAEASGLYYPQRSSAASRTPGQLTNINLCARFSPIGRQARLAG
jgi:hypothetical protein